MHADQFIHPRPDRRGSPPASPRLGAAALALAAWMGLTAAAPAQAQVTFYEHDGFGGRSYTTRRAVPDFTRVGFNDLASSAVVAGQRWEVCQDAGYGGRCMVLRPGRYGSLGEMGFNDKVSSVRLLAADSRVADERYAPQPAPAPDFRRRGNEALFDAPVSQVRAVRGPPQQRCWVERGQVEEQRGGVSVPGAIVGGLLGGILGHQVGGGTGRDLATVGGLAAGAAVGAQVGRGREPQRNADVQRCTDLPGAARTDYWDVTYDFRGQTHQVQMDHPPGATVRVNRLGEPRV